MVVVVQLFTVHPQCMRKPLSQRTSRPLSHVFLISWACECRDSHSAVPLTIAMTFGCDCLPMRLMGEMDLLLRATGSNLLHQVIPIMRTNKSNRIN
jgi:hypothetical protein